MQGNVWQTPGAVSNSLLTFLIAVYSSYNPQTWNKKLFHCLKYSVKYKHMSKQRAHRGFYHTKWSTLQSITLQEQVKMKYWFINAFSEYLLALKLPIKLVKIMSIKLHGMVQIINCCCICLTVHPIEELCPIMCKYSVYLGHLHIASAELIAFFHSPCCTRRYLIIYSMYKHALSYHHTVHGFACACMTESLQCKTALAYRSLIFWDEGPLLLSRLYLIELKNMSGVHTKIKSLSFNGSLWL